MSDKTSSKPVAGNHQNQIYNSEAYKAYYNTAAGSPHESRSPSGNRVGTAPHYQQYVLQSPNNRLFFNFHPNFTPS